MTGLRSAHLVGLSGIGGAYFYAGPREIWLPFLALLVVSGILMAALEIWSSPYWLVEIRGLAMVAKIAMLGAAMASGQFQAAALVVVIVISGVISHAPSALRYYSVWHRRRTH
jgi:hypothetical protein